MMCNFMGNEAWVAKLEHEICRKKGPPLLTRLLEFIKDKMLHLEREDRADCESILDYFDSFVDKRCTETG